MGSLWQRDIPNGGKAEIMPLTFGRARICLIEVEGHTYKDVW